VILKQGLTFADEEGERERDGGHKTQE